MQKKSNRSRKPRNPKNVVSIPGLAHAEMRVTHFQDHWARVIEHRRDGIEWLKSHPLPDPPKGFYARLRKYMRFAQTSPKNVISAHELTSFDPITTKILTPSDLSASIRKLLALKLKLYAHELASAKDIEASIRDQKIWGRSFELAKQIHPYTYNLIVNVESLKTHGLTKQDIDYLTNSW